MERSFWEKDGRKKRGYRGKSRGTKGKVLCSEKLFHQYLWQVPKQFKAGIRATKCRVHRNNISLGGFVWSWERSFFLVFPSFFPTSRLSFHLWRRMLWFSWPDVTLHPVHFRRTNKGGRERRVCMCVQLEKCVVFMCANACTCVCTIAISDRACTVNASEVVAGIRWADSVKCLIQQTTEFPFPYTQM